MPVCPPTPPLKEIWRHLWPTPRRQGRLPWWLCRCCKGHFGRSPPFFYCCIVLPVWVSQFSCYFPLTYITFTQWDKKMRLVYVHCTICSMYILNASYWSVYFHFEFCMQRIVVNRFRMSQNFILFSKIWQLFCQIIDTWS